MLEQIEELLADIISKKGALYVRSVFVLDFGEKIFLLSIFPQVLLHRDPGNQLLVNKGLGLQFTDENLLSGALRLLRLRFGRRFLDLADFTTAAALLFEVITELAPEFDWYICLLLLLLVCDFL